MIRYVNIRSIRNHKSVSQDIKVTYHKHTAWEAQGLSQYDMRYFSMVFQEIQWLLTDNPKYNPPHRNSRIVLERKDNALFRD